jgi:hypothetical protein
LFSFAVLNLSFSKSGQRLATQVLLVLQGISGSIRVLRNMPPPPECHFRLREFIVAKDKYEV